jgi:antitoxin MazE
MIYILLNVYQEAIMQVSKWGNSLAIRLPASVVEALELKEGDDIEVRVAGTGTFEVERKPSREEWLKRLRRFRGVIPADFKFDREEANAR